MGTAGTAKTALITGITGQDGSYLAEMLLNKGYAVHGMVRRSVIDDPERGMRNLRSIQDRITLHPAALDNHLALHRVIDQVRPDECYHLAAPSFVSYSLDDELAAFNSGFSSTHALLAGLKEVSPQCRFYFAGTSEMFGTASVSPQNERTAFNPRSIYGIAKLSSYHLMRNYREKYGIFACAGILYNHESPRRGIEFVTRKITAGAAKIKLGLESKLVLGNLDAQRDWGYAPEYVEAMWKMLQRETADDYVVATGITHSVREFVESAFECVGLDYREYVGFDERYFRPSDEHPLVGDAAKARKQLDWAPQKGLKEIVKEMVAGDLALYAEKA